MKQQLDNQKQNSIEAEIALLRFKEQGGETSIKIESTRKIKIHATIILILALFFSVSIFLYLKWPSNAIGRILGVGLTGWFMILFSENIGKYKGNLWLMGRIGTRITEETPNGALRLVGWIFIFVPVVIALLNLISK